ncbi:hypothetical protein [Actinophytocola sp.]|uniref:hypothetical protein n=1 Tax=Actinophytocola sp. TaxID=1872138 RepID=UPI003D6A99D3
MTAVACTELDGSRSRSPAARTARFKPGTSGPPASSPARARPGHDGDIVDVARCELDEGTVAVTAGEAATVRVWNLATGTQRATLAGYRGPVAAVACARVDGRALAVTTGTPHTTLAHGDTEVPAMTCGSVGGHAVAVTGDDDATVRVWDLATGTQRATLTGHRGTVTACPPTPTSTGHRSPSPRARTGRYGSGTWPAQARSRASTTPLPSGARSVSDRPQRSSPGSAETCW